jgi:hypothetical protein
MLPVRARLKVVMLVHLKQDKPRFDRARPHRHADRTDTNTAPDGVAPRKRNRMGHVASGASARGHNRLVRCFGRNRALDDNRLTRPGCHKVQAVNSQFFDALWRTERLDLETKMPADFFLLRPLSLHLFEPIPVSQQFEVLPC